MSNNSPKKKIGRPRVDSEKVSSRFHRPALDAIDRWADARGVLRPEAIRLLVAKALEADACEK